MKPTFRQIEVPLLVGAATVGVVAALIENRFTLGGLAASVGLTSIVALGLGVMHRRAPTIRLIVIFTIVVVMAFVVARLLD